MARTWRLIPSINASGFTQMAIDEWLLEQHRLGDGLPCLRFYTWQPIAISLGYHQRHYPSHWHDLTWQGQRLDIVRRPSGGRAVLHQGDLTYSLIVSGYSGRRRDVYAYLCQFLVKGWQRLGISLYLGANKHGYQRSSNCFGTATAADLVIEGGYKAIGSAQLYRDGCILQHGSMRLTPDPELFEEVFGTIIVPPPQLNLQSAVVATILAEAAQEAFGISLETAALSSTEIKQATVFAQSKYHASAD